MFCNQCGTRLSDGAKFCRQCGAPVRYAPQQSHSAQPPAQPQAAPQKTFRTDAAIQGAAKKAGGGLLGKLVKTVLVLAVGGTVVFAARDLFSGGGGGEPTRTGGNTIQTKQPAFVSVTAQPDGALGEIELRLQKTVYEPKANVSVECIGISEELVKKQAWICIAGANSSEKEYLSAERVRQGRNTVTLKAPGAVGSYEVRFYKGKDATKANLVPELSRSITVKQKEATEAPQKKATEKPAANSANLKKYRFDALRDAMGMGIVYVDWNRTLIDEAFKDVTLTIDDDGRFSAHGSATRNHEGERHWREDYAILSDMSEETDKYAWSEGSAFDAITIDLSGQYNWDTKAGSCTMTGSTEGNSVTRTGYKSGKVETDTTAYTGTIHGKTTHLWSAKEEGKDCLYISFFFSYDDNKNPVYDLTHDVRTTYSYNGETNEESQGWEITMRFVKTK